MRVQIRCPNCEQMLRVREEEVGTVGRCPTCKQVVRLERPAPQRAPKPAAAPVQREEGPTVTLATETDLTPLPRAVPLAPPTPVAPHDETVSLAPLDDAGADEPMAVAVLEDDAARSELSVRGTIAATRTGPRPLGKPRNPALVMLLSLVPFYVLYWFITIRAEIFAYNGRPPESSGQFIWRLARFALLGLVTAGLWGLTYCYYTVPKRIAAVQASAGNPNRISPGTCLFLAILPLGALIDAYKMQKALTEHWQWCQKRGASASVTAGLAR